MVASHPSQSAGWRAVEGESRWFLPTWGGERQKWRLETLCTPCRGKIDLGKGAFLHKLGTSVTHNHFYLLSVLCSSSNKKNLDMRQLTPRPSPWSQKTHEDGEQHSRHHPSVMSWAAGLETGLRTLIRKSCCVSLWFQTGSHKGTTNHCSLNELFALENHVFRHQYHQVSLP